MNKTYDVEVSRNIDGIGTCGALGCERWGNIGLTFRDVAAMACSDSHAHPAAVELVRNLVRPSSSASFFVRLYSVQYRRTESAFISEVE